MKPGTQHRQDTFTTCLICITLPKGATQYFTSLSISWHSKVLRPIWDNTLSDSWSGVSKIKSVTPTIGPHFKLSKYCEPFIQHASHYTD